MFLSNLNDTEKEVFCKLANIIACIDGVVPEELNSLSLSTIQLPDESFSFQCGIWLSTSMHMSTKRILSSVSNPSESK